MDILTNREIAPVLHTFLNQNDVVTLCQTNKKLNNVYQPLLYSTIYITRDPVMRCDQWYLDGGATFVSGYRSYVKTKDQNDMYLWDRLDKLTRFGRCDLIGRVVATDAHFDTEITHLIERLPGRDTFSRDVQINHVHRLHGAVEQPACSLHSVKYLTLTIGCDTHCSCMDTFFETITPQLGSLRSLTLIQDYTIKGNHSHDEEWDLSVCKFLTDIGPQLSSLTIKHKLTEFGDLEDSVEGNYNRRRGLYAHILPQLVNLRALHVPNFLSSVSPYEILVCDLLWNGCECEYCEKILPVLDAYLMNHQFYYSNRWTDVTPTVFFNKLGKVMAGRWTGEHMPPAMVTWDFHGDWHHFSDYDCHFDGSVLPHAINVVSHFINTYLDHWVKWLPKLEVVSAAGVYYTVSNGDYELVY